MTPPDRIHQRKSEEFAQRLHPLIQLQLVTNKIPTDFYELLSVAEEYELLRRSINMPLNVNSDESKKSQTFTTQPPIAQDECPSPSTYNSTCLTPRSYNVLHNLPVSLAVKFEQERCTNLCRTPNQHLYLTGPTGRYVIYSPPRKLQDLPTTNLVALLFTLHRISPAKNRLTPHATIIAAQMVLLVQIFQNPELINLPNQNLIIIPTRYHQITKKSQKMLPFPKNY